jgi:hypothetical protein
MLPASPRRRRPERRNHERGERQDGECGSAGYVSPERPDPIHERAGADRGERGNGTDNKPSALKMPVGGCASARTVRWSV